MVASRPFYYILSGIIKNYNWGEKRKNSQIYQFAKKIAQESRVHKQLVAQNSHQDFFAELWFGAHPQGIATLISDDAQLQTDQPQLLDKAIFRQHDHLLGKTNQERVLPFLFKYLTARKPLSIQAHPDIQLAIELHASNPKCYSDFHHKSELVVCVEDFSALVGFLPISEQLSNFRSQGHNWWMSQFWETLPWSATKNHSKDDLPQWFLKGLKQLCEASKQQIHEIVAKLLHQLKRKNATKSNAEEVFVQLCKEFKYNDRGLLFAFLMNYYKLKPGQAMYIPPNLIHSYLKGRVIECMTNSDNVVRAGLTNKYCDVYTLLRMQEEYLLKKPQKKYGVIKLQKQQLSLSPDESYWRYPTPTVEFKLSKTVTKEKKQQFVLCRMPTIVFCLSINQETGSIAFLNQKKQVLAEQTLHSGYALFLPGDLSERKIHLRIRCNTNKHKDATLTLYWCSMRSFIE